MSLAADILALRDLIKEGHLGWHEAAQELRAEHDLDLRGLYVTGAAELFQQADQTFSARRQRITMSRHVSGQALKIGGK